MIKTWLTQAPARAVFATEETVSLLEIGELQIGGIPEQPVQGEFFPELDSQRHVAQEDGRGERSGRIR